MFIERKKNFCHMIKISIITVCYNSKAYIEQTIKSVLAQTYENIEYIVIDGGSTDGTIDIINRYRKDITIFISEPDRNMYDAINKGMKWATGDYIAILNSDDFYLDNEVISVIADKLKGLPSYYKGLYGNLQKFTAEGYFMKRKKGIPVGFKTLLCSRKLTFVGHGTLFVSQKACDEVGLYDFEQFSAAADYDYILRLFKKFKFKYVDCDIMGFRVHEASITSSGRILEESYAVLGKNGYKNILFLERVIRYYASWSYFVLVNFRNMRKTNWRHFFNRCNSIL